MTLIFRESQAQPNNWFVRGEKNRDFGILVKKPWSFTYYPVCRSDVIDLYQEHDIEKAKEWVADWLREKGLIEFP